MTTTVTLHADVQKAAPQWPTFDMGQPLVDLIKAMALADELDDDFARFADLRPPHLR